MARCPRCGSDAVEPVVYAASGPEGHARLSAEAPRSAGLVDLSSPNHRCESCGHAWPDQARLDAVAEIRSYFAAMKSP